MQRDPERVLPTHVSGNRLTNLSTSCGPCNSLWTSSSPSWQRSGAPGEHWLGQSPTEGQESFCGSPGFQRRSSSTLLKRESEKKREFGEIGVDRQTAWLCLHHPSPRWHRLGLNETCLAWGLFHGGKKDLVNELLAYPAVWDTASETHFSLTAFRVLNQELRDSGRKEIKKMADKFSESSIKKTLLLLTA